MSAIRLARAATSRRRIVKFAGCYHGHSDALLAAAGSGLATYGLPASAGVSESAVSETIVVPYNVVPDLDEQVACVIVEPVAANMGLVPPEDGFLAGLRRACDEIGALLIFDEVITGFRLGRAGAAGLFGVRPDLFCFGKVIGGGLPLAAFGARRDVMEQLAPDGPVYQAGTLSGNPVATAAGLAVLELLTDTVYVELRELRAAPRGRSRRSPAFRRSFRPGPGGVDVVFSLLRRRAGARLRRSGSRRRERPLHALFPRHARLRDRSRAESVRSRLLFARP